MQEEHDTYNADLLAFQEGKRKIEPDKPVPPPVLSVPNSWSAHTAALNVIADFTNKIEGDLVLQQELYVAHVEVEATLEQMIFHGNVVAKKSCCVSRKV